MTHPHGPECTCMLDGPDYPEAVVDYRYEALLEQNKCVLEENRRLKALLDEHNIIYYARSNVTKKPRTRSLGNIQPLPHLPKELQLKILGFAMTFKQPIIDPFCKPRREHLTSSEKEARKEIHINFLATCKAFHVEGLQHFITNNEFVFTQVAALERFAQIPAEYRSTINHATLRIVGRYYDNTARKQNLLGLSYHPEVREYKSPILARPSGAEMDKGIHAYCYHQFADFLKALQVPKPRSTRGIQKLLPSLKTMRIDLVNFCDHLWHPGRDFSTVIRWHTGPMVDELVITGVPEDDPEEGVESIIDRMVKNQGVFASGPPIFASMVKGLKPLKPLGLAVRVVRCEKEATKAKQEAAEVHPEGGKPPKSFYPPGRTIWKYTQERLDKPERKWIEFDRRTGYPADDIDMWSDFDDDEMFDSDGNIIDPDEEPTSEEISSSDDDMPGLEDV